MNAFPKPAENVRRGLLLVGHGTRDVEGQREFLELAAEVARQCEPSTAAEADDLQSQGRAGQGGRFTVAAGFLELATPTIADAVRQLVATNAATRQGRAGQGGTTGPAETATFAELAELIVAPLLLFTAGHAKRDIPAAVAAALGPNSPVAVRQLPAFGCDARLLQLSAERFREALAGCGEVPPGDTRLILVGRGSSDAAATAEMSHFTQLRAALTPVGHAEACFIALARPTVAEALQAASESAARRIVVQPHLLFRGELLARLAADVQTAASLGPRDREWILAPHLGPHPALAALIVEMAQNPEVAV